MEESVRRFHLKYGHYTSDVPTTDIPIKVEALRKSLIDEEHVELSEAMTDENLTEIADGIGDLIYVLVGTAISYGIPIDRVFREIHRSNMTKTAIKAEDGAKYGTKTPKGDSYVAPDIEGILLNPNRETFLEVLNKLI